MISSNGGNTKEIYEQDNQRQLDSQSEYWPAPLTIHRGLEWPQFLNCSLSACSRSACLFSVGKFSNFFVQYKAAGVRKNVVRMNNDVLM